VQEKRWFLPAQGENARTPLKSAEMDVTAEEFCVTRLNWNSARFIPWEE
jgi:hypothetical protein